jgi:hypothetical protein
MLNQLLKDFSSTFKKLKNNADSYFGNDKTISFEVDIKFCNAKNKLFKEECYNLINFINTINNISVPPDKIGYTLNYSQGDIKETFRDTLKVENNSEYIKGPYNEICHIKARFYLIDTEISQINDNIVQNINKHPKY